MIWGNATLYNCDKVCPRDEIHTLTNKLVTPSSDDKNGKTWVVEAKFHAKFKEASFEVSPILFCEEPSLACKPTFLGSKSTFGQFLSVISVDNGIGTWHSCLSARCGRSETTRRTRGCRGRIQQKSCRSHCTNVSKHPL